MAGSSLGDLFFKLGLDTTDFSKPLGDATKQFADFNTSVLDVAQSLTSKLTFAAAGTAIAELGVKAFESAGQFEDLTRSLGRVTGTTGPALDGLAESVKHIYGASAQSAEAISGVLSTLAIKTGETGSALEALTQVNLKFAKVTGTDTKDAVTATQRAFGEWGIATDKQAAALNELYYITTKTGITAAALAGALQSAGAPLKAFGFSFTETAALIGNFEKHGLDAGSMISTLTKAMAAWAKAGIQDPKEQLLILIDQMKNAVTSTDAMRIAAENFSKRGAVQLADAVRSGGFEFKALADGAAKATDAMATAAGSVGNWSAEWTKFKHQLDLVLATLGGPLLSALTNVVHSISGLLAVSSSFDEVSNKFEKFKEVAAGLGGGQFEAFNEALRQGHLAGKSFGDIVQGLPPSLKQGADAALDFGIKVKILGVHATAAAAELGDVAKELARMFSVLGQENFSLKLPEMEGAFASLTGSGQLGDSQIIAAAQKLEEELKKAFDAGAISAGTFHSKIAGIEAAIAEVAAAAEAARPKLLALPDAIQQMFAADPAGLAKFEERLGMIDAETAKLRVSMADSAAEEKSLQDLRTWNALNFLNDLAALNAAEALVADTLKTFNPLLKEETNLWKQFSDAALGSFKPYVAEHDAALKAVHVQNQVALDTMIEANAKIQASNLYTDQEKLKSAINTTRAIIDQENFVTLSTEQSLRAAIDLKSIRGESATAEIIALENLRLKTDALKFSTQALGNLYVSTVRIFQNATGSLSHGIADAIVQSKNLGDVFKKVAQDIATQILEVIIKSGIQKLLNSLAGVDGALGKVGRAIGGIGGAISGSGEVLKEGGSLPGGTPGDWGGEVSQGVGIAGQVGSQTTQVAGAAASSLAGWINVGVSALSGIVQGIQGARLNNLMAEVEESTRYARGFLLNLNTIELTYMPELLHLKDIWASTNRIGDKIGGGGNTFNITVNAQTNDPRAIADTIVRQLKLLSPSF